MKKHTITLITTLLLMTGCNLTPTPANVLSRLEASPSVGASTAFPLTTLTKSIAVPCMQTAMTQFEMNECSREMAQVTYAKLQQLIEDLKPHIGDAQYARLLVVEKKWEAMIKEHCRWQADFFDGGSVMPLMYASCLDGQYSGRINMLRLDLCEGHGMTGECEESMRYKEYNIYDEN